jgi:hypothetical protein
MYMSKVIRHDAITLHRDVKQEEFEKFMTDELFPYFRERYQGPTRISRSDLKSQSLLLDTKGQRKYLWITVWEGGPESVRGSSFENTRMNRIETTEVILKKLESFGKRSIEKVFSELANMKVDTNT